MFDLHAIVSALIGGMAAGLSVLFWKYFSAEKRALEKADSGHEKGTQSNSRRISVVEKKMVELEVSMHREFVRRDDWVPQMTILQAKIDSLAEDVHKLLGAERGKMQ